MDSDIDIVVKIPLLEATTTATKDDTAITKKPRKKLTESEKKAKEEEKKKKQEDKEAEKKRKEDEKKLKDEEKKKKEEDKKKKDEEKEEEKKRKEEEKKKKEEEREEEKKRREEDKKKKDEEKKKKEEEKEEERKKREEDKKKREEEKEEEKKRKEEEVTRKREELARKQPKLTQFFTTIEPVIQKVTQKSDSFLQPIELPPNTEFYLYKRPSYSLSTLEFDFKVKSQCFNVESELKLGKSQYFKALFTHSTNEGIDRQNSHNRTKRELKYKIKSLPSIIMHQDVLESLSVIKLLKFHDTNRPSYYGTYSKTSKLITPKNPLQKDESIIDYDYDSADEWEEEVKDGENLDDSDDEKDESDEEEEEEEEENNWIDPENNMDVENENENENGENGENVNNTNNNNENKSQKHPNKKRKMVQEKKPIIISINFEYNDLDGNLLDFAKQFTVEPILLDLPINLETLTTSKDSDTMLVDSNNNDAKIDINNNENTQSSINNNNNSNTITSTSTSTSTTTNTKEKEFPIDILPTLLNFIKEHKVTAKIIVDIFKKSYPQISKILIKKAIDEYAIYSYSNKTWDLKPNLNESLMTLNPTYPVPIYNSTPPSSQDNNTTNATTAAVASSTPTKPKQQRKRKKSNANDTINLIPDTSLVSSSSSENLNQKQEEDVEMKDKEPKSTTPTAEDKPAKLVSPSKKKPVQSNTISNYFLPKTS